MTEHIREYEDALFKAAIYEMAKDESKVLMDKMNLQEAEAPSELLDKRVHNMMATELKKSRTKKFGKKARKTAMRAVVVIMAIVTVSFTVTMSVEALRSRFVSFLMTFTPRYTELQLQEYDENGIVLEGGQPIKMKDVYVPSYIPAGFEIISMNTYNSESDIVYQNDNGEQISFTSASGTSVTQVDTENADNIETIDISNSKGLLVEKEGLTTVTWSAGNHYFVLMSRLSKEETIKIAKSVVKEK